MLLAFPFFERDAQKFTKIRSTLWKVLFWTQEYLPLTRREAQLLIKLFGVY